MSKTNKPLENDPAESKKLLDTQKSIDVEEVRRVCAEMPLTRDTTCGVGFLKGAFLQKLFLSSIIPLLCCSFRNVCVFS